MVRRNEEREDGSSNRANIKDVIIYCTGHFLINNNYLYNYSKSLKDQELGFLFIFVSS